MVEEYIPYFIAVVLFVIGFFVGKSSDKKMIANVKDAIVQAHNVDRILDDRDKDDAKRVCYF